MAGYIQSILISIITVQFSLGKSVFSSDSKLGSRKYLHFPDLLILLLHEIIISKKYLMFATL